MTRQENRSATKGKIRQPATVRRLGNELAATRHALQERIDQLPNLNAELETADKQSGHLASFPQVNPNPVLEVAASGRVTYFNPATQAILAALGMDKDNIAAFFPADMNAILHDLDKKGNTALYREIPVGSRIFAATVHLVPQFDVARIYAFDITEHRQAEEALRKSEERLNRAQEIAHLGSWELDLTNNVLTWSDEVASSDSNPGSSTLRMKPFSNRCTPRIAPQWTRRIPTRSPQAGIPMRSSTGWYGK